MPFPRVTKGLSIKEYISRCASSPAEVKAFPDVKQRVAVCASHYREVKKKQNK